MPFALDNNPELSEVSDAINYLLANISSGIPAGSNAVSNNPVTGFVSNTVGDILQYQYRYLDIKFADNPAGLNFSDNPYGRLYFGVRNTEEVTESTNPADYTWFIAGGGGFGINTVLWIAVTGGRHVTYAISQDAPDANQNWQVAPIQAVDLDNPFKVYEQYMTVRFATNSVGAVFSTNPTNAKFYGIYTSADGSSSVNPTDYAWSPFEFGTTYNLYYRSLGGRNISFIPSTYQPIGYIPYANLVINLDVTTSASVNTIGIISTDPLIVQSPYRYLIVRYASTSTGGSISTSPTGKTYFGIQTSDVIISDSNPADYTWFYAGGTLLTDVDLWARVSSDNIVQFSSDLVSPDTSGWTQVTDQTTVASPFIDVYLRPGLVVTNITSPTDGRLGYSSLGSNGIVNLNLDPYGQGKNTSGFEIDITTTATVAVDQFGRVYQTGALDQVRYSALVTTATSGQTVFTISNYQTNQVMVFRNGMFLKPGTDFTRTTTDVTLTNGCVVGDIVQIYYVRLIDGGTSADKVSFVYTSTTLTSGQTTITSTFIDGSELIFINGCLIVDSDYSYIGGNSGYVLSTPSVGGSCVIVSFAQNNAGVLIFGENYTETATGTTNVVFPTPFYRNSHLMWLNGCLLKPSSDYTIPGSSDTSYNYTSSGFLSYSGQPSQFCSFNSAGSASSFGLGSMGVLGYDMPVEIEKKPTIKDMFLEMQAQIDELKLQLAKVNK
jgi:hypothetical protein